MKKEVAEKWVQALRSGKFVQGGGQLADGARTEHCCLGVLCELAIDAGVGVKAVSRATITEFDGHAHYLPQSVRAWAGLASVEGDFTQRIDGETMHNSLSILNDEGKSFHQIANEIERLREHL